MSQMCFVTFSMEANVFFVMALNLLQRNMLHLYKIHRHHGMVYCGKFCIAFVKYVHSKHSYNQFIEQFDFVKLYKNDLIVANIYI